MRRVRLIGFCLLVGLVSAGSASAAITGSSVTAPGNGTELFYEGDSGSGSVTVQGTATGSGSGDLLCYSAADTASTKLASTIPLGSGNFAFNVSLQPVAGQACRLAMVPAGKTPLGAAAAAFAGPAISVSDQFTHSTNGNVFGYNILSGPLTWSFKFQSLGECPVSQSWATDPSTLGSFQFFAGNSCLLKSSGIAPGVGTRSGLQVDGLNAYPPGAISALTSEPGFSALSYSSSFDGLHDTVTINETEYPTICDAPGGYPPTPGNCPSLHSSGLRITQTSSLLPGGQVARVVQRIASVDGRPHSIDALFQQAVIAPGAGQSPGFEFPGQSSFATHAVPDAFSAFPSGPSSIIVIGDAAAGPATSNPIGAITYARPPKEADFVSSSGAQTASMMMHYVDTVPANGSILYDWAYSQSSSGPSLASLERVERDRFLIPSLTITRPRNRFVTKNGRVLVSGSAFDPIGLSSVTVAGRATGVSSRGAYAAFVSLRPGRNVIIVKAVNLAGSTRTASVTVNYKAPPCRVPKLQSKTLSAAIRALARADCTLGKVKQVRSRRFRKGHVISSRPMAGTRHRPLYRVGLVVSRGR